MNLKSIISEFSKKYGQNAAKMEKRVLEYINGGIAAETAIKRAFADTGLLTDLTADIQAAKMQAVSLGIGYDATGNAEITTALNRPWDGTGVTFSQRIHLGGEQMRAAMVDEIKSQLKLGASAVDVARSLYDGYGYGHIQTKQAAPDYLAEIVAFARRSDLTEKEKQKLLRQIRLTKQAVDNLSQNGAPNQALKTAYNKLLEAVQGSNQDNINKAVSVAINEKSRYVAERIARTEAGRAYFDGVIAKYKDNPLVIAYKWELASRHPAEDICDMYAGADLFGLGPGIFPKKICPPMPAHPNCLCLLYPVFQGEADLTKQAKSPKAGGIKWLQLHPEAAKNILPVNASADNWINVARGFSGFSNPISRLAAIVVSKATNIPGTSGIIKPKTQTIENCKTVSEVEALLKQQQWFSVDNNFDANAKLSMDGMDLESAKTVFTGIRKIFDRYPMLKGKLGSFNTADLDPATYGQCSVGLGRGGVALNKKWFKDAKRLSGSYERDKQGGFHPQGTTYAGIVIHEFGHAIDDFLSNNAFVSVTSPHKDYKGKMLRGKWFSSAIRPKILRALKIKALDIGKAVSDYATKDAMETFAEAFAEFIESPNPRPFALAVKKHLEEALKEVK